MNHAQTKRWGERDQRTKKLTGIFPWDFLALFSIGKEKKRGEDGTLMSPREREDDGGVDGGSFSGR